jgi:3-oxoadipate enol-lactonase
MVHERFVTMAGRPARYLESGSGRPLVLIHGFPFNADMWRPQLEHVPHGWHVLTPDLRGFGAAAGAVPPAITMDDHAADVIDLMNALAIEQAVIGGLSMGGYIAFALFRLAPSRIAGLILADTRPQPDSPEGLRNRRALLDRLRSNGVKAVADDLIPKLVCDLSRRERPDVVATVRSLIEASRPDAIEAAVEALMARPDSTADLDRIACPTGIIVGEEDTITPRADAEMMQRAIKGSTIAVVQNAAHMSNLEQPDVFNEALSDFLTLVT